MCRCGHDVRSGTPPARSSQSAASDAQARVVFEANLWETCGEASERTSHGILYAQWLSVIEGETSTRKSRAGRVDLLARSQPELLESSKELLTCAPTTSWSPTRFA